jgi:protein-S-isoprenylcysteine O-methyltransferase Ste14
MTLNRNIALTAVFIERYVLSLVYLWLAWIEFHKAWGGIAAPGAEGAVLVADVRHLTQLLLALFTGLLLLLARGTAVPPQKLEYILVPTATTFYTLVYYTVPWFPPSLQTSLCPPAWHVPLAVASLLCMVSGPLIALWGLSFLGRSFGIFITVKKVVLRGPYQWVRHPMYLGWVCVCTGVALANFSVAYFLLVTMHICLLLYRAHLEETQLAGHSPEYREYMKHVGFIFPKFRHPAAGLPKAE